MPAGGWMDEEPDLIREKAAYPTELGAARSGWAENPAGNLFCIENALYFTRSLYFVYREKSLKKSRTLQSLPITKSES
jgi:hypothetical protein